MNEAHQLATRIAAILDEKKGQNILIIDLRKKSIIADYFVIVSAKSITAVKALADTVEEKLSKDEDNKIEPLRRDGLNEAKWIAIDYGGVIVHVFHQEMRDYYQLERLWIDGDNCETFGNNE